MDEFVRCMVAGLVVLAAGQATGCSGQRFQKSPWLVTERDAARYLEKALDSESPDVRRNAIIQLSKTRYAGHDTVIDACSFVVRTDRSACVRSAAIRLIAESLSPNVASTLVQVLDEENSGSSIEPQVCVDVLHALYFLERHGAISEQQRGQVVTAAIRFLHGDPGRDVKIASATLLGEFPRVDSADALVAALRHEDFGVVYQAERSLIHMTGARHHRDPRAWQAWLDSTETPFAMGGRLDAELEPMAKPRWWQRAAKSVKGMLTGFRSSKAK